jgi:hypothetical protein
MRLGTALVWLGCSLLGADIVLATQDDSLPRAVALGAIALLLVVGGSVSVAGRAERSIVRAGDRRVRVAILAGLLGVAVLCFHMRGGLAHPAETRSEPELELTSWSWSEDSSEAVARGEVRNISDHPLDRVSARVSWYTEEGSLVISGDALIEDQPLSPGKTSLFQVVRSRRPAMKEADVQFEHQLGRSIPWRKGEPAG